MTREELDTIKAQQYAWKAEIESMESRKVQADIAHQLTRIADASENKVTESLLAPLSAVRKQLYNDGFVDYIPVIDEVISRFEVTP